MKLSQILSRVKTDFKITRTGYLLDEIAISEICLDSRLAKENSIFFALPGKAKDGTEFIADALKNGASIIVAGEGEIKSQQFFLIESTNPFALLTEFLQIFYQPLPANIYAITGTNGKTSVAEFTRQILQFLGKKSASIGTLGVMCDANIQEELQASSLTTPDLVSLYKNLSILKKSGVDDVAIEVSSIGLEQERIAGLEIAVGAFTNFTQDHLDYHKSMEEYFRCKMILFDQILSYQGVAVLNCDISEFEEIKKISIKKNQRIIEYGFKAHDLKIKKISETESGQRVIFEFAEKTHQFDLSISGDFQAFNALCALGNVLAKNKLDEAQLSSLLENFHLLQPALGRMQSVGVLKNKAQIFVDFAHSPDALMNVLKLARRIAKSRVLVLFGCGGNRDAKKRPLMGKIACDLSDLVIVTDDNPRGEEAEIIRGEILAACDKSKAIEIANRKTAIEKAILMLEAGDLLILAGKGHEKYQIIGETKFEFDEEKIVKNVLKKSS